MHRSGNDFVYIAGLARAKHAYKFIVDDEWRFAPDQLTVADTAGNINNYVDLATFTPDDDAGACGEAGRGRVLVLCLLHLRSHPLTPCLSTAAAAPLAGPEPRPLGMGWVGPGPISRKDSPPGVPWGSSVPDEDEYAKDPPVLPPHLRTIVLNEAAPAVPSVLAAGAVAAAAGSGVGGSALTTGAPPSAAMLAAAASAASAGSASSQMSSASGSRLPMPGGPAAAAGTGAPVAGVMMTVDPMSLPKPLPVCLGHLYCTAIKDGIIVQVRAARAFLSRCVLLEPSSPGACYWQQVQQPANAAPLSLLLPPLRAGPVSAVPPQVHVGGLLCTHATLKCRHCRRSCSCGTAAVLSDGC
jgi:hypothetical protein